MRYSYLDSPLGRLLLFGGDDGLTGLFLPTGKHQQVAPTDSTRDDDAFTNTRQQLDEYFAGTRREFQLLLRPAGSEFQLRVWRALAEIPYAQTRSYVQTAMHIGVPAAARAVGLANGRNPISIVVPCHRVIGANGSLTGYGGGLEAKQWLLAHEQRQAGLTLV